MVVSTPNRATDTELAKSQRAKEISRNWLEARENQAALERLDTGLGEDTGEGRRATYSSKRTPLSRIQEARLSGMEVAAFERGLGGNSSKPATVDPRTVIDHKAKIAANLAAMKIPPEQARQYMEAVSPFLDSSAFADDPWAQRYMLEKFQQGHSPTRDSILEAVKLGMDMRGSQPQQNLDVGQLMKGMSDMFRAGIEVSKGNGSNDPVATLNAIFPLVEKMNEGQRLVFENQLQTLREELRRRDPSEFVETMKRYSDLFGWSRQPESEQVQLHRLDALSDERKMAFELEKERWAKEWDSKIEDRRAKNQGEMIRGIMGTASKIFESPIAKELGKNVGKRIGVAENPVEKIRSQAAQSQLATPQDPMSEQFRLQCHKCKSHHVFTRRDLLSIESRGGKWVCDGTVDGQTCGEVFLLKNPEKKDEKDDTPSGLAY